MNTPSDDIPSEALTERYDVEARAYRAYWAPVLMQASSALVHEIPTLSVRRVLDIGAGAGTLFDTLTTRFPDAQIVGVDRSAGMLSLSQAMASVAVMDAIDLAFGDDLFDVAVMCFTLFHLNEIVAGLSEARRVLKSGGRIYLSTWHKDITAPAAALWAKELDASGAIAAADVPRRANHDLVDNPEKVTDLLGEAGFRSAHAAVHDFSHPIQREDFISLRTQVGGMAQRLQTLDKRARREFVDRTRRKLAELPDEDFNLKMRIVLASAEAC